MSLDGDRKLRPQLIEVRKRQRGLFEVWPSIGVWAFKACLFWALSHYGFTGIILVLVYLHVFAYS